MVGVELGLFQQLRHAENRVHRSANLVRHAREKFRFGARRVQRRLACGDQLACGLAEFGGSNTDLVLDFRVDSFQPRTIDGDRSHLVQALHDRNNQKEICKDDPSDVFSPSPRLYRRHPIDR